MTPGPLRGLVLILYPLSILGLQSTDVLSISELPLGTAKWGLPLPPSRLVISYFQSFVAIFNTSLDGTHGSLCLFNYLVAYSITSVILSQNSWHKTIICSTHEAIGSPDRAWFGDLSLRPSPEDVMLG